MTRVAPALALLSTVLAVAGCHDLSGFSTGSGSFTGPVVGASFVLAGMDPSATLCMTLDTNHLQDGPGSIWSLETPIGSPTLQRFTNAPLRPIPQLWQDPLSTFSFGEGRLKNLMYVATADIPFADGNGNDVFVVVSLMQSGNVEVRLLRGAPGLMEDGGPAMTTGGNLFAVFDLGRQPGPCLY